MHYHLVVLGCQMNASDAEKIRSVLTSTGGVEVAAVDDADLVIFVTCSVKQKAEDKVFGSLKKMIAWKKKKVGRQVALTGCMTRITSNRTSKKRDPLLQRSSTLDIIFRIEDVAELPNLLAGNDAIKAPNEEEYYRRYFGVRPTREKKVHVFVPIQAGCDNWCSYCIVPITRGSEVSRPRDDILDECREAVDAGAIEITLLGQNVDSYQKSSSAFAELLESVAEIPSLARLRFTSSHPKDTVEEVMDVMARHENIERHLHFAAQHGDDDILKRMNRGYTADEFLAKVALFRKKLPTASVTTDLIVGFPGETEEAFQNLLNFYKKAAFEFAFISRYSPRIGTASAKHYPDDVPREVKAARWHTLNEILRETTAARYKKMLGKTVQVLVESCERGMCVGRSSEYFLVKFLGNEKLVGTIVPVEITHPRDTELTGRLIPSLA